MNIDSGSAEAEARDRLAVIGFAEVERRLVAAREDVARMRKQIADHEEAEASVCPEDVGFVEFIGVLQKRIAGLERALIGVTPSHRVKGKCWCPIAVDTGVTHSKACQAARTALAAQTTAAVEAVEGMRMALDTLPCACKRLPITTCPQCGGRLEAVTYTSNSMLNRDQFDSVRAGDWYCTNCKGVEASSGYKYWWDSDLGKANNQQCPRCDALAAWKEATRG